MSKKHQGRFVYKEARKTHQFSCSKTIIHFCLRLIDLSSCPWNNQTVPVSGAELEGFESLNQCALIFYIYKKTLYLKTAEQQIYKSVDAQIPALQSNINNFIR